MSPPTRLRARQWIVVSLLGVLPRRATVGVAVPLFLPRQRQLDARGPSLRLAHDAAYYKSGGDVLRDHAESGRTWTIDPMDHLSVRQVVHVVLYPDMALQFSHSLADSFRAEGYEQVELQATVMASLNGRES